MAWTDQFKIIELVEYRKTTTLDSGIDVAPWINVAPGTFGNNINHSF